MCTDLQCACVHAYVGLPSTLHPQIYCNVCVHELTNVYLFNYLFHCWTHLHTETSKSPLELSKSLLTLMCEYLRFSGPEIASDCMMEESETGNG